MTIFHYKFIDIFLMNPFKTYWKVRKYFIRPKAQFFKGTFAGPPYYKGTLFSLCFADVQWKDKWNMPRHERNPIISIGIGTYRFGWIFSIGEHDMQYWESILQYLYYNEENKTPLECCLDNVWEHFNTKTKTPVRTFLKNYGYDLSTRVQ